MAPGAVSFESRNSLETCWTFNLFLALFTGRTAARASRWKNKDEGLKQTSVVRDTLPSRENAM